MNDNEFQLVMFFPNDEFSVNLDEADAWWVEDFDDDEEIECPECGASTDEDHDPTCMFVNDDDDDEEIEQKQ